jgi:hypothetical protein
VTTGHEPRDPARAHAPARRHRIDADPETVERGLVSLVLTVVELLRQLMERQALRRVDDGSLADDQVEKLGSTLMSLEGRMAELRDHFGLAPEDLNLDLGPLGPLLPYELRFRELPVRLSMSGHAADPGTRTEIPTARPDLLREATGLVSSSVASEPRLLSELVAHATRQVPACGGAGAMLWRDGEHSMFAASHPDLPELTEVQLKSGRGPALDALSRGEPVGCPDTLEESRWTEFAGAALRAGVRCSLSVAYRSGADAICLSLFGARPRMLEAESEAVAGRLVALGGAVMDVTSRYGEAQRTAQQLHDAAEARAAVDQAKGVLMHALGCSAEEALERMRQISQERNMKVTDVATTIIDVERSGARRGRYATS